jgi:multidrug efflux pump subunit AcrA (membrane-fusion protein)
MAEPDGDPPGGRAAHGRVVNFCALILAYACSGDRPAPPNHRSFSSRREVIDAEFTSWALSRPGRLRPGSEVPAAAPIPVTVSYPVERDVTDHADFTGRTAAVDSVEVRARVSGYLDQVNFKEGALVKKDDKLFQIDARPGAVKIWA